jgi:hypothetical protein
MIYTAKIKKENPHKIHLRILFSINLLTLENAYKQSFYSLNRKFGDLGEMG